MSIEDIAKKYGIDASVLESGFRSGQQAYEIFQGGAAKKKQLATFSKNAESLRKKWLKLPDVTREFMAWTIVREASIPQDDNPYQPFSDVIFRDGKYPPRELTDHIDKFLTMLSAIADDSALSSGEMVVQSKIEGLKGLHLFVRELKRVWESELGTKLGRGSDDFNQPFTEAGFFVRECVDLLDKAHDDRNCQTVMRNLYAAERNESK